jgi:hypothetical protein
VTTRGVQPDAVVGIVEKAAGVFPNFAQSAPRDESFLEDHDICSVQRAPVSEVLHWGMFKVHSCVSKAIRVLQPAVLRAGGIRASKRENEKRHHRLEQIVSKREW